MPPPSTMEASAAQKHEPNNKTRSTARFAKKSTSTPTIPDRTEPPALTTRSAQPKRLAALATKDKMLENFNPDTSNREKRKLERKMKIQPGAAFDGIGYHIATGISLCDCLDSACVGCFFPCKKCTSPKCGPDCRNNRKIIYESVEFHGFGYTKKNPLEKDK